MSTKGWILSSVDLIIATILNKLIFKTFKEFLKGNVFGYFTKKDFDISYNYSNKLIFLGAIFLISKSDLTH
jgi:hypothetical protein